MQTKGETLNRKWELKLCLKAPPRCSCSVRFLLPFCAGCSKLFWSYLLLGGEDGVKMGVNNSFFFFLEKRFCWKLLSATSNRFSLGWWKWMLKLILREWDLPTSGVNLAAEEAPFQWKGDMGRETGQQVQWDMPHWEVKPPWEPQNKHPNLCESSWGQGSKSQRRTSKTI